MPRKKRPTEATLPADYRLARDALFEMQADRKRLVTNGAALFAKAMRGFVAELNRIRARGVHP